MSELVGDPFMGDRWFGGGCGFMQAGRQCLQLPEEMQEAVRRFQFLNLATKGYIERCTFFWAPQEMSDQEVETLRQSAEGYQYRYRVFRKIKEPETTIAIEPADWDTLQPLIKKYGSELLSRAIMIGKATDFAQSHVPPLNVDPTPVPEFDGDNTKIFLAWFRDNRALDGVNYCDKRGVAP